MPCKCTSSSSVHFSIPQCVALLGEDAEKKLPGLVWPLCGCHNDVVPWVQVHLPPHSSKVTILSRTPHQWVSIKKRLAERTCAVLKLLGQMEEWIVFNAYVIKTDLPYMKCYSPQEAPKRQTGSLQRKMEKQKEKIMSFLI